MYVSSFTLNDYFDEVATRLNEVSADEAPYYRTWANLCTFDIAQSFPNAPFNYVSANRTISAGTRHYTHLPSDFDRMAHVLLPATNTKLKYLTEDEFANVATSASQRGDPTVYTLHGATDSANTQVEFYPIPGTARDINYWYRKLPNTVSATSATLPIPTKYVELYNLFGYAKGLRRREDFEQAQTMESQYELMKQKMIDDFKMRTEEPWRVKSIREMQAVTNNIDDPLLDILWGNG